VWMKRISPGWKVMFWDLAMAFRSWTVISVVSSSAEGWFWEVAQEA